MVSLHLPSPQPHTLTYSKSNLSPFLACSVPLWTIAPSLPCPATSSWVWPIGGTYRRSEEERGTILPPSQSFLALACISGILHVHRSCWAAPPPQRSPVWAQFAGLAATASSCYMSLGASSPLIALPTSL